MPQNAENVGLGVAWELFVDETNLAADTYYYPAEDSGQPMTGFDDLSLRYILSGGVTMTVEAMQDLTDATSPEWEDITVAGYDLGTDSSGNASYIDLSGILHFDNLNVTAFRIKIVTSDGTNAVKVSARYKSTDK